MKPAERMFAGYAVQEGFAATFEPDWSARFGRAFKRYPDFLICRRGDEAIVEVREFTGQPLTKRTGHRGFAVVDQAVVTRPVYSAIADKARQLQEFGPTDLPLIIALAKPRAPEVDLGDWNMKTALFGKLGIHVPIGRHGGAVGASRTVSEPGYGVFRRTDPDCEQKNIWPHVSGVAVLSEFDLYSEFQDDDRRRYVDAREPADSMEAGTAAAEWALTPVGRREAPGPSGSAYGVTYYDLAGYPLGSGPQAPADWFAGERDRRFGFDLDGVEFGPREEPPAFAA